MLQPLSYETQLSYGECLRQYRQVERELDNISEHYRGAYGLIAKLLTGLEEEHIKSLTNGIGILLPLGMMEAVQEKANSQESIFYKLGEKMEDISMFLAKFPNTGVTMIPANENPFDYI